MLKRVNPLVYIALVAVLVVAAFLAFPGPRPMYYPAMIGLVLVVTAVALVGIAARVEKADWLFFPGLGVAVIGICLVVLAIVRFVG